MILADATIDARLHMRLPALVAAHERDTLRAIYPHSIYSNNGSGNATRKWHESVKATKLNT